MPAEIWPWLVQMGCDRSGFYSYDRLDNGGRASAESILPEFQDTKVGDVLPSRASDVTWYPSRKGFFEGR
jgi:hypothetical protein